MLSIYLGQTFDSKELIEKQVLKIWDKDAERGGSHPAYYHPNLSPILTGFSKTLTRKQYGGCVLPAS